MFLYVHTKSTAASACGATDSQASVQSAFVKSRAELFAQAADASGNIVQVRVHLGSILQAGLVDELQSLKHSLTCRGFASQEWPNQSYVDTANSH